jgi:segregation and condensation protein A
MATTATPIYNIKLEQFEGPFDLLLFFIERDELDIYNIPIFQITSEFLAHIKTLEELNIELASEFILFASTLMRIKAKMLIPRKEIDEQGNEIDPRKELIDKILEYKRFKEASEEMAIMEANRVLQKKRAYAVKELAEIGETMSEGTDVQSITVFKLFQQYEKVIKKMNQRNEKPQHVVVKYNYTMEGQRDYLMSWVKRDTKVAFVRVFQECETRVHALFNFLALLELSQQKYLTLLVGEGRNNFIIEWNNQREEEEENPQFSGFN